MKCSPVNVELKDNHLTQDLILQQVMTEGQKTQNDIFQVTNQYLLIFTSILSVSLMRLPFLTYNTSFVLSQYSLISHFK